MYSVYREKNVLRKSVKDNRTFLGNFLVTMDRLISCVLLKTQFDK